MSELYDIINWRRLSQHITLSGQPTEEQIHQLNAIGVTRVINLGPHTDKGALDDETGCVTALGMAYIYIPVDFENPTDDDFSMFCAALERVKNETVHVHCIYNARVSAFIYRYAKSGLGFSVSDTFALMDGIWRPGGIWAEFIGDNGAVDSPNQYAGEDY